MNLFNKGNDNNNDISEDETIKQYFNDIKATQKKYYHKNISNNSNVKMSLIKKDFVTTLISPQLNIKPNNVFQDWYQYFYYYLYRQSDKNIPWASEVIKSLENEYFIKENKFQSMFFFQEFQIKTQPVILKKYENDALAINNGTDIPINQLFSAKNYGGSFVSAMSHSPSLFPEDLQNQYIHWRSRVKEYVDVFSQHLQCEDHPIKIIANVFCKAFSSFVNNEIEELKQLSNNQSNVYKETLFNKSLSITKQLQKFIIRLQITLKLFYCQTIDYQCFAEEKDELVTSIISLLFQDDSLYQSIYNLYDLSEQSIIINLSDKFNALRNIQPEDLRIDPKYCLNRSTLNYQKKFLRKKGQLKIDDEFPNEDNNDLMKEIEGKIEQEVNYFSSSNTNDLLSYQLNIVENNSKIEDEQCISLDISNMSIDKINNTHLNGTNIQNKFDSKEQIIKNKFNQIKQESDEKIQGFKSAINMLESIKDYRSPFEKMIIITKIGEKIAESVNLFWKDLNSYLSPGFLTIDADNLLSIFIYLLIKSKMSTIAIHSRIIRQFTTTTTKLSTIGYYYSTLEASINYIDETDKNELMSKIKSDQLIEER